MDIVICTVPIRQEPSDYPPFGSLAIMQALRKAGWDPYFLDIDALRPSFEETTRFFKDRQPDVLGISAVVSTSYSYVKRLVRMVKTVSPKTRIVLGGNMAASAEICHRLAGIDYCAVGEGEKIAVNLCRYLEGRLGKEGEDFAALSLIKGLTFLDGGGRLVFTGYETDLPASEIEPPDYSILEKYSRIENFLIDPLSRPDFAKDTRSHEPHRRGKKRGVIVASKGCVSRCTFCHRWEKGYRVYPVEKIIGQIRYLVERHNVGFILFADENFGSDKRQLDALIEALKSLDIVYMVGGVRCSTVDQDLLRRFKESGCVSLNYGMETGSARILEVMEKRVSIDQNLQAALWTQEQGIYNIYQIVLGMPGECSSTVSEATEFFKKVTQALPESPLIRFRVNYLQVLPGTPVYEYARRKGMLGKTLEDEERYLLRVSDVDAADETRFLNLTGLDYWTVQSWRRRIIVECIANHRRKRGIPPPSLREIFLHTLYRRLRPREYERIREEHSYQGRLDYSRETYFNLLYALYYDILTGYLYPVRTPILWAWLLAKEFQRLSLPDFLRRAAETVLCRIRGPQDVVKEYRSVRWMVGRLPVPNGPSEEVSAPLRAGR
ncbi:MAG: radical SAM protein [Elusimicrobiota bacterium]|jgi:radical SAM superfamily enzyme YgiQ (UPF0313 family)